MTLFDFFQEGLVKDEEKILILNPICSMTGQIHNGMRCPYLFLASILSLEKGFKGEGHESHVEKHELRPVAKEESHE